MGLGMCALVTSISVAVWVKLCIIIISLIQIYYCPLYHYFTLISSQSLFLLFAIYIQKAGRGLGNMANIHVHWLSSLYEMEQNSSVTLFHRTEPAIRLFFFLLFRQMHACMHAKTGLLTEWP